MKKRTTTFWVVLLCLLVSSISHAQISGTKNIPGDYATLALAITDLNTQGVGTGGVTLNVLASNPQTAPAGGYVITATGTSSNPIIITGNANSVTASASHTAGNLFDGIIKIVGGDYITIQNFNLQENAANTATTLASNTMTEFGIGLFYASVTDGAQNNTLQNNAISLNGTYQNSIGIFSTTANDASATTAAPATANTGFNSGLKIYGNTINNVKFGIYLITPPNTATLSETGIDIGGTSVATGNTITYGNNTTSDANYNLFATAMGGIVLRNGAGGSLRYNTITSTSTVANNGILISASTTPVGVTYTTTVSNNNLNMTNTGTTAVTAADFGYGISTGTIISNDNVIVINQNVTAASSAAITGIKANYATAGKTTNNNNITINQSSTTGALSSATMGINLAGTASVSNIANSNTILFSQNISSTTAATTAITGIGANSVAPLVNVNQNKITINQAISGSGVYGSGAINYINVSAASGTINVTDNNLNTTGGSIRSTGALVGVFQDATVTVLVNVKSDTFNIDRIATTGSAIFQSSSTTPSEVADTISGNVITMTGIAGTSTATAISSLGGPTAPGSNSKNINNNIITISGTTTGITKGIIIGYSNGTATGNIVNISASGSVTGIETGTGALAESIYNNTLSLTSSGTSPTILGVSGATGTGPVQVYNNTFQSLSATAASTSAPTITGIQVTIGSGSNVYNNNVTNISTGAGSGGATIAGISVAGTLTNVYKNKVYGINTGNTGTATIVSGIRITAGTAVNVYNNLVGDLTSPASANPDGIRGINITSTTTTSALNVYYNTVYLNAASSGANFGTSGIFHTVNATATTAKLVLRNNAIVNNSTASGTGLVVAYRRSGTALNNYDGTSNNNVFYGGAPGAGNLIFYDGTTGQQTMASYKTIVTQDQLSQSENPVFLSTVGSAANFLHINPATATLLESGGAPISGYTDDFDGQARNSATPDIGADEFNGISPAPQISNITLTPPNPQCTATARTVTATVSTAGTPITSVTLNYNNGVAGFVLMTLQSGTSTNGVWSGVIPVASPVNTIVAWSINATNAGFSTNAQGSSYKDAYLLTANTVATVTPGSVCANSPATLSVSTIDGSVGLANIGTQSTTIAGANGNPYRTSSATDVKVQLIYSAAELAAAGLSAGNITSLAFTTTTTTGSINNFTISMGATTTTSMSTNFVIVPMTTVFTQASFTPIAGLNTHILSTPFNWDGVSNILIQVCQSNPGSGTSNIACYTPSLTSNLTSTATGACAATTGSTATAKPIIQIGGIIGTNYTNSITYTWTPGSQTGSSITVSPASTQSYVANGIDANGCTVTSNSVSVTTIPQPTAPSTTNSTQCGAGIPTGSVASTAGVNGNGTFLWYDAPSSGNLVQGLAVGTVLAPYYSNNFSTATLTNASLSGAAAITTDTLRFHPASASQTGGFTVNASGINSTMFQTSFDLVLVSTGTTIADGFSYSFGDDAVATTTTPTAEHGSGSKLRIGFFTYNTSGASDGKGIYLMYGVTATTGYTASTPGVLAYSNDTSWVPLSASTLTSPVSVNINAAGQLTLTVGSNTVFNNVQLPAGFLSANKSTWKHVFSSRSGGVAGGFGMDNLSIQANTAVPGYTTYQSSISASDTFYVSEMGVNGCQSQRTPIIFTVGTPIANNIISSAQSICAGNSPAALTGTTPTGGGGSVYNYTWQGSTTSATTGFTAATGTNNAGSYNPPVTTQTTWYRRYVVSAGCADTSAAVEITVTPAIAGNTISSSQTICTGTVPAALTGAVPTGGTGTYSYTWQSSTAGSTTGFTAANGTNNTTGYIPAAATQTTWFRRYVTSGNCSDTSAAITINVTMPVANNTISGSQTLCNSSLPTMLTGSLPTGGGLSGFTVDEDFDGGTIPAAWNVVTTNAAYLAGFATINSYGRTGSQGVVRAYNYNYNTTHNGQLTRTIPATTGIERLTFDIAAANYGGTFGPDTLYVQTSNGSGFSNLVTYISTNTVDVPVGITTANATTSDFVPTAAQWTTKSITLPAGTTQIRFDFQSGYGNNMFIDSIRVDGLYSYEWLSSTTSGTSGYNTASGTATGQNYTPGAVTQNTWYKRVVKSGVCSNDTSASVKLTITTPVAGNTISASQTICSGSTPAALAGSTPTGGGVSGFSVDEDFDGGTVPAAWSLATTNASYLAGFATINSYGRTGSQGVVRAYNYNYNATNHGQLTRTIPATTGVESLTFDIAAANYGGTFGPDTLYIQSGTGSGFTTIATYISTNTVDVPNGITTANATTSDFVPTASQWTTKSVMLPAGTTQVRFDFQSGYGNNMYIDSIRVDALYNYEWLASTTSATAGYVTASGTANTQGYTPGVLTQNTWYKRVVKSGLCGNDTSAAVTITANAIGNTLAATTSSATIIQADGSTNTYSSAATCGPIVTITDTSGGNILGSVTASVVVDASVQTANGQKYLQRHYDITPASNGAATLVLYATQAEFTAYNAATGTYPAMPTTPADPNAANVRVTKFSGTPFTTNGTLITPTSVLWNSTKSWWEITIPVASFSSFYIHTGAAGPLDINLESIAASNHGAKNRVDWESASEVNADKYELERSIDGKNYKYLATVKAKGEASTYSYWDENAGVGINYYRLRMFDNGGAFRYSKVVTATVHQQGRLLLEAYPNPVSELLKVKVTGTMGANAQVVITDMSGRMIMKQQLSSNEVTFNMARFAAGMYFINYADDVHNETIKVNKQ